MISFVMNDIFSSLGYVGGVFFDGLGGGDYLYGSGARREICRSWDVEGVTWSYE